MDEALRQLVRLDVGRIHFNVPLVEHSWWRIGGPADVLIEPGSVEQVQTLARALWSLKLRSVVIGHGSNLLFDDAGVRGVVVKIGPALSRVSINDDLVTAEAGAFVPCLVRSIGRAGLSGLEHAIGIPGSIGGLVLMNGGSLRKEVGSNIELVRAVNEEGDLLEFDRVDCGFAYRYSALQEGKVIVVEVRLRGSAEEPRVIRGKMLDIMRSRREKFPLKEPNCGSVFLSEPSMYATVGPPGKVIESCGLKGLRIGDAMVSNKHANFIVNLGHARSYDVLSIIAKIRESVLKRTGFRLKCEVRYVSPDGRLSSSKQQEFRGGK